MARGFSQAPGASADVLDAARWGLDRARLAQLAQSRHREVRETVARRTDNPVGIQAALAQDDAPHVRAAVAANPSTVKSVLEHLGADRNQEVLAALLTNPSAHRALVEQLALHRRNHVRTLAFSRLHDAAPVRPAEMPRAEDAMFPELRERATTVGALSLSAAS
jgi:hypothetical protein